MALLSVGALMTLSACSEYDLSGPAEGAAGASESADPGTVDTAGSADTSSPTDSTDVAPSECADLVPAPAGPGGPATCTALNGVDWNMVIEWERVGPGAGYSVGFPAIIPGSSGGGLVANSVVGLGVQLLDGGTGGMVDEILLDSYDSTWPISFGRDQGGALMAAWQYRKVFWWSQVSGNIIPSEELSHSEGGAVRWVDIDGDGALELVSLVGTVRADGSTIASFAGTPDEGLEATIATGDFDGDGRFEVVNSAGLWDATSGGVSAWSEPLGTGGGFQVAPVLADGAVNFLGADGSCAFRAQTDGDVLWMVPFSGNEVDGIAVGDVDGDGIPEMVVSTHGGIRMLDVDGAARWAMELVPAPQTVSMADLDADGSYEVIAFGQAGLQIIRGSDGTVLSHADVYSAAVSAAVIADIDNDGSAEIVVVGFDSAAGDTPVIRAYGAASGRWARTRPVWNAFDYDVTSVGDDGQIIAWPIPSWEAYNSFRAQPAHDGDHPDLTLLATDLCCDSEVVHLAVQAQNLGSAAAPSGAIVRLVTNDGTGWREVASHTLVDGVSPESSAAGFLFEVPRADWGLRQVLQIDGADGAECDRVNDRVVLSLACDP